MEITWLGHSCFRLKGRGVALVTDPFDKSLAYPWGKPTADIVTVSHQHPGHSFVAGIGGKPRVVKAPGEYEISGVSLTGIKTYHDAQKGQQMGPNVVFVIEMEDLRICHLGDLGHVPTAEQVEQIDGVDVLLIPVGGVTTINAEQAAEIIRLVEPKLTIPMHYQTDLARPDLQPVSRFLKETGLAEAPPPQPKLVISKSSFPTGNLVLLEYPKPNV